MRVRLGDLVEQYHGIQAEVDAAIRQVLESGAYILGEQVERLEAEVASFSGAAYGVALNSGTDALLLALVSAGIGPGDEVITTPFTFVATVESITLAGARPVLAEIDPATFNLCPRAAAAVVTPKTRALMPVDLYGQMSDRGAFGDLAQRHGLHAVYDSAQAVGATYAGRPLAAFPGCATLSFYPTKNLGAFGDGGMVLCSDDGLRERLRLLRFHGSGGGYAYERVGYCSRLDALQAAVLRAKLPYLPAWTEARCRNARIYREALAGCDAVLPAEDPSAGHVYHQFTIRHPRRDALKAHLAARGIDSGVYYPGALHLQRAYADLGYREGDFPEAERACREVLSIPIHPQLTPDQCTYVAETIRAFDRS